MHGIKCLSLLLRQTGEFGLIGGYQKPIVVNQGFENGDD